MNFKELMEGAEPKMPGAPKGIQIMTPQQFVAKAGDMAGEESDEEGVEEGIGDTIKRGVKSVKRGMQGWGQLNDVPDDDPRLLPGAKDTPRQLVARNKGYDDKTVKQLARPVKSSFPFGGDDTTSPHSPRGLQKRVLDREMKKRGLDEQGVAEGTDDNEPFNYEEWKASKVKPRKPRGHKDAEALGKAIDSEQSELRKRKEQGVAEAIPDVDHMPGPTIKRTQTGCKRCHGKGYVYKTPDGETHPMNRPDAKKYKCGKCAGIGFVKVTEQGVAEGLDQLNRICKLSGLDEATKLPAQTRDLGGQEFQDYMNRIVGTPDVDKKGNVKVDKKGNEKYVSGKTKSDRYKMPYIHRSSVITYIGPDGKTYDEDKIKQTLAIRPKNGLLKQNEKMKHSNGEFEQFFNVGFAALTGIALDQQTNNLIIVNTCPGAGSCKVDCFAMKGSKVQFKPAWQNDGRILTYLLNDPTGFFNQLSAEITKEKNEGKKGNKKFPNGWNITVRWHDAGDFFSPEYLDLALKMAEKHPDVKFYAYTKMASAALAKKPDNFIINWSEGAHTSQEKQIKAADPNLENTKNSRIVPDELFQDLLVKDEKKNLVKGDQGQWQVQPNKLPELKQRLAKEYGLSPSSILNYQEYMAKRKSIPAGMKYNVIVAPGEGDISANDQGVLGTLLLKH